MKSRLVQTVARALLFFGPLWLCAQKAPLPHEEVVALPAFAVTGSFLARTDLEHVLPITVLGPEEMALRDAAQPSDLLTGLPEVTGLPGNERALGGAEARGDNANVSFRGLSSGNTLILLNGRRLAPHPISGSEGGVPALSTNVNQLPNRGLTRIEVLRDGASSAYGTDAVAGVVNYVTRKNLRGTELSYRFAETNHRDGVEQRATVSHGFDFAGRRGRAMVTADFTNRQALYLRDRPFSVQTADGIWRAPAPFNVPNVNFLSTSSAYGSFSLGTITARDPQTGVATAFAAGRPAGVSPTLAAASGQFFLAPGDGGAVVFSPTTPSRSGVTRDYYWNNNAYRILQPQSTRGNVFAGGEFDLNRDLTAFADVSFYQARSRTYREPDVFAQTTDGLAVVPASNPFNPFGDRFWSTTGAPNSDGSPRLTGTPSAVAINIKRLSDLAIRTATVTDSVYRGVAGLRGRVTGSWTWEAALLWSAARVIDYEAGANRRSLLLAAMNQTDRTQAFNPFTRSFAVQNGILVVTGDYQNPPAVIATFQRPFVRNGITKLGSGDLHVSGDLFPLWGGKVATGAMGGEFRYEAYDDYRPPYTGLNPAGSGLDPTNNDFVSFSPNADTHGNRHVAAVHAETLLPLVGRTLDFPLMRSFELVASARYESYTDFGDTAKPKLGLNWRPTEWILARASYNQGFRAPNLAQLFTGNLVRGGTFGPDPYRFSVTQLAVDGVANFRSVSAGNQHLKPETSAGKSAGFVIDLPRVRGLSVAVDYWEIGQANVIATGSGYADDATALNLATQAALAAGKPIGEIDLGSGTAAYRGDPSVVRLPVTPADRDLFAAFNAKQVPGNQRAVVGAVNFFNFTYFNKARQFVNGFDCNVNYRLPPMALGNLTFSTSWTYLNDFHAYTTAGSARLDYRKSNHPNVGGATPLWRGSSLLTWRRGPWSAGVGLYYIGRYLDVNASTSRATWEALGNPGYIEPVFTNGVTVYRSVVHDSKTYNVFLAYRTPAQNRFLKHTMVRAGANNVLNAKPPLETLGGTGFNPAVYNPLARGVVWSLQIDRSL